MIDAYLRELGSILRVGPLRKRRILAEVRAHLEDAGGDAQALERFGPPATVARRFNEAYPEPAARLAALTVLAGSVILVALVQGLDDLLPPAPWPSANASPGSLQALFTGATVALVAAVASAGVALVLPRCRVEVAAFSALALSVSVSLLAAHAVERATLVPRSPAPVLLVSVALARLAPPIAAAALLVGLGRDGARPGLS